MVSSGTHPRFGRAIAMGIAVLAIGLLLKAYAHSWQGHVPSEALGGAGKAGQKEPSRPDKADGPNAGPRDIRMVDRTTGWATGESGAMLRTDDGGVTWRLVSPAAAVPETARISTEFVNDQIAAQVIVQPDLESDHSAVSVRSTADGGQHWRDTSFHMPMRAATTHVGLRFAGTRNAWIYLREDTMFANVRILLVTADGGATWFEPSSDGCTTSPVSTVLGTQGGNIFWGSNPYAGGVPTEGATLFWSKGDVCNWSAVPIGIPRIYRGRYFAPMGIRFFNEQDGVLSSTLHAASSEVSSAVVLFRTSDGGQSWVPSPALTETNVDWGIPVFSDSDHGWILGRRSNQAVLYTTVDGGKSWSRVNTNEFAGTTVVGASFVDSRTGWLEAREQKSNQRTLLWKTTDGGVTWTQLKYLVQP